MIKKRLLNFLVMSLIVVAWNAANSEEVKKLSAVAKKPVVVMPNDPVQYNFLFDKASDLKAWLRDNGDIHVEGFIKHNHFRCGTYQLGVQFGSGDGCVNLKWNSEPIYVSRRTQCNQALLHHEGYQNDPKLAGKFNEITCAQLLIKCDGVCGVTDIPMSGGSSDSGVLK